MSNTIAGKSAGHSSQVHSHSRNGNPHGASIDPVCGMKVDPGCGTLSLDYRGETHRFCSQKCLDLFAADPWFYLSGNAKKVGQKDASGTLYTCPMHPEIVRDRPGNCPICGMALEPMNGAADEPNRELVDFTRRLWVSAGAVIPLLLLTMGPMLGLPIRDWIGEQTAIY
ncbi:MAG: heavy metal-binding domain-containing protein, partial [Candidatus Binatia bacterium]